MNDWTRLTAEEMIVLWWAADLGEPPPLLDLLRPGNTPAQRAEHTAATSEALRARGLGTVHELVPALATTLRRLATAATKLDL